jgi:hypothetical protein
LSDYVILTNFIKNSKVAQSLLFEHLLIDAIAGFSSQAIEKILRARIRSIKPGGVSDEKDAQVFPFFVTPDKHVADRVGCFVDGARATGFRR